ncbi:aldehyde dehydrogenase family protein [Brevundimonas sp. SL130]|uniref:aldehyde dehydrogenase family protein n=1 Tax=Brevundimonas sp. SL130 TaxID=2995143 RepID=UPI00226C8EE8|nr:aldehyde dehydrogenase family protein [Brevundimonas sp. SL130]WAC59074.1 aldehyde dehydrogenase family protein [Brevundimonas sp. SL130]
MGYQSINPFDGVLVKSFNPLADAHLELRLAAAETCFQSWKLKSYDERAAVIAKAGELLHARADEFARIMTMEMGKRINESRGEVEYSARILAYYAKHAERFLAPVKLHPVDGHAHMESSPMGVIFCVEPWNFPYYQLARVAGPHLMAAMCWW